MTATARRDQFAALVQRVEGDMLKVARRLCQGNDDRAQDLVQDALIRAYSVYRDGQLDENAVGVKSYFLRIVTNLFINDYRRRTKWDAGVDVDTLTSGGEAGPSATHACVAEMPHTALLAQALDEPLERALNALPEALRLTVLLVDVQDYSYEEAAQELNVPVGTVRSRLSRARFQLQENLHNYAKARRLI